MKYTRITVFWGQAAGFSSVKTTEIRICIYTGLFEMIVGVSTTCHTQYNWDRCIYFLFNRTALQVFVTYLTGALYVHPLWFYKHQHDNGVRYKLSVACQRWWFQWPFWFVPSVPGYLREEEEHKPDPWRNPIERNHMGLHLENEVARRVAFDHHRFSFVESQMLHIWSTCKTCNKHLECCSIK